LGAGHLAGIEWPYQLNKSPIIVQQFERCVVLDMVKVTITPCKRILQPGHSFLVVA
jgi:hypothetical protein